MPYLDKSEVLRLTDLTNNEGIPYQERLAAAAQLATKARLACMSLIKKQETKGTL